LAWPFELKSFDKYFFKDEMARFLFVESGSKVSANTKSGGASGLLSI